jgi:hypothetical protein
VRKTWLTAAMLALLLLCAAGTLKLSQQSDADEGDRQAVIVVERTVWDFGQVRRGLTLRAKFPVTNVGDRRLVLHQRTSSCECVAGEEQTIILQPGESTEVTATLDTRELQGAFQMEFAFTTSAPNLPTFQLTLLADIQPIPHPDAELGSQ